MKKTYQLTKSGHENQVMVQKKKNNKKLYLSRMFVQKSCDFFSPQYPIFAVGGNFADVCSK